MYDLLHAMEGSEEEEEGLRAHIIVLIKVMCCLFQDISRNERSTGALH